MIESLKVAGDRPQGWVAWTQIAAWVAAALVVAATAVSIVLWGLNGPAYLVDLIAAYCL